jgi:lipid-binding SYLF domain-containing protein
MKQLLIPAIALTMFAGSAYAANSAAERLTQATDVLVDMTKASDKGIPQDLLEKAQCIVVIPELKKGGFIVGAKYGKGFISCRHASGMGWTAPGAMRVEGGSFGLQIGGAEADVVLLVMNSEGAKKLLESKFTLGADATVAAGPVGRDSSADTDAKLTAGILSYSRARGAFAGLALQGGTLREDLDDNAELYGSKLTNKQVLAGATPPAAAASFMAELNMLSHKRE